jgi:hypothetical protein
MLLVDVNRLRFNKLDWQVFNFVGGSKKPVPEGARSPATQSDQQSDLTSAHDGE